VSKWVDAARPINPSGLFKQVCQSEASGSFVAFSGSVLAEARLGDLADELEQARRMGRGRMHIGTKMGQEKTGSGL